MAARIKISPSCTTFFLLALAVIFGRFLLPRFETHDALAILSWDVFGYYLYLPASFLHHDLGLKDFTWIQQILDTYRPTNGFYQAYMGPEGEYVMKYPLGLAIFWAPFFFTGWLFSSLLGFPADGFSLPFQVAVAMGNLVYTIIGLWFFRKVLKNFFSEGITAVTMTAVVLGTNYFQLTAYDGAMPHNVLFTLFTVILWLTIRWHEERKWRYAILIGILAGLAVLVRPTAGLIILVPLLWGGSDRETWKAKGQIFRENYRQIIAAAACLAVVVFLQMIYWKIHAGSYLYYSYEPKEKIQWIAPYLPQVLFSFRKGWLIYTPLMVFAVIGFYFLAGRKKEIFFASFVFFVVHLLFVASWPTWWYGGSLGQRTMMESYVVLALPLGYFFEKIFFTTKAQRHGVTRSPGHLITWSLCFVVTLALVTLNLFQTWQYMNFIISPSDMNRDFYFAIFGKRGATNEDKMLIKGFFTDEHEKLVNEKNYIRRELVKYDFSNYTDYPPENVSPRQFYSPPASLRMHPDQQFSPGLSTPFENLTKKPYAWIRATVFVYSKVPFGKNPGNLVITMTHNGVAYKYRSYTFELEPMVPGIWNRVTLDYLTPYIPDRTDLLNVYIWYRGGSELLVDDLSVELFESVE